MKYLRLALSYLLIAVFPSQALLSQGPFGDSTFMPFLYSKNHLGFNVSGLLVSQASILQEKDIYSVGSSPQRGFSFAMQHFTNFSPSHSLVFHLSAGVLGRNFEFNIPRDEFDPPADIDIQNDGAVSRKLDLVFLGLGAAGEKRWFHSKIAAWKAQAGIQLQYSPSTGGTTRFHLVQQNQTITFFYFDLSAANKHKPWHTYFGKGGYTRMLKNKDFIGFHVGGNLSFTDFATGSYTFVIPNKPDVDGKYRLTGSHFFIGISYVFTGVKKKLQVMDNR